MRECAMKSVRERETEAGRVCTPPLLGGMVTSMRVMMAKTGTMACGMTEKETGIAAEMTTEITIGLIQHQGGAKKYLMHHDKLKHVSTSLENTYCLQSHACLYIVPVAPHRCGMAANNDMQAEQEVFSAGTETGIGTGAGAQAGGSGRRHPGGLLQERMSGTPHLCGQAAPGWGAACGARTQAPPWITLPPLLELLLELAALEVRLNWHSA